jgi:tetratricopeptide (TPR) repeat protein
LFELLRFFQTIHERSLWQIVGTYGAGSWVVLQVVETLAGTVGLPEWVGPGVFVLLAIGLPILLITALFHGGVRGRAATSDDDATAPASRWLTWRQALLAGVGAFTLFGLATAAYLVMRTLGIGPAGTLVAKGILDERSTIVLADFAPVGGDDSRAVTEALRVDLSQSRVIRVADERQIGAALARMERDPSEPLDQETALELSLREGFPAVIAGEINRAGLGYVFSVELLAQSDDEVLASERVTARDSTEVIDAIEKLSKRLRERIGESLARLDGEPALTQVTTSNLEALRRFSLGKFFDDTGTDAVRARILLEEAIALDSAFASAWQELAIHLLNRGEERALQVEAFERAFRHRDRLTERERYRIDELYYLYVVGDRARAEVALENLLAIDPDDAIGLAHLGNLYLETREYERSEEFSIQALAVDPTLGAASWNLSEAQGRLGKFDEAEAAAQRFNALFPNPFSQALIGYLGASRGDYDSADSIFAHIREAQADDPYWLALTSIDLASVAAVRGQVDAALAHLGDAAATNEERDAPRESLKSLSWAALLEARTLGDADAARARLTDALAQIPLSGLDPLDRPYSILAEALASAGDLAGAKALLDEMEAELPSDLLQGGEYVHFKLALGHPDRARAEIAVAEGRYDEAIGAIRRSDVGTCQLCALPGLARAYDAAGQADSALAVYRRYLDTPEAFRLASGDAIHRGIALERLGQLYDEAGDEDQAAKYYAEFATLWKGADPVLQPRVRAATARIEEIEADAGAQ